MASMQLLTFFVTLFLTVSVVELTATELLPESTNDRLANYPTHPLPTQPPLPNIKHIKPLPPLSGSNHQPSIEKLPSLKPNLPKSKPPNNLPSLPPRPSPALSEQPPKSKPGHKNYPKHPPPSHAQQPTKPVSSDWTHPPPTGPAHGTSPHVDHTKPLPPNVERVVTLPSQSKPYPAQSKPYPANGNPPKTYPAQSNSPNVDRVVPLPPQPEPPLQNPYPDQANSNWNQPSLPQQPVRNPQQPTRVKPLPSKPYPAQSKPSNGEWNRPLPDQDSSESTEWVQPSSESQLPVQNPQQPNRVTKPLPSKPYPAQSKPSNGEWNRPLPDQDSSESTEWVQPSPESQLPAQNPQHEEWSQSQSSQGNADHVVVLPPKPEPPVQSPHQDWARPQPAKGNPDWVAPLPPEPAHGTSPHVDHTKPLPPNVERVVTLPPQPEPPVLQQPNRVVKPLPSKPYPPQSSSENWSQQVPAQSNPENSNWNQRPTLEPQLPVQNPQNGEWSQSHLPQGNPENVDRPGNGNADWVAPLPPQPEPPVSQQPNRVVKPLPSKPYPPQSNSENWSQQAPAQSNSENSNWAKQPQSSKPSLAPQPQPPQNADWVQPQQPSHDNTEWNKPHQGNPANADWSQQASSQSRPPVQNQQSKLRPPKQPLEPESLEIFLGPNRERINVRVYSDVEFQSRCLDLMNKRRLWHENTPSLVLGDNFTRYTIERAVSILNDIADGKRDIVKGKYAFGESFYYYYDPSRYRSVEDAISTWYDESRYYDYEKAEFSAKTGGFTQLVWKGSREASCVKVEYETPQNYKTLVVANFWPAGNVKGEFPRNVQPVRKTRPDHIDPPGNPMTRPWPRPPYNPKPTEPPSYPTHPLSKNEYPNPDENSLDVLKS